MKTGLVSKILAIAILITITCSSIGVFATWHYASTPDIVDDEESVFVDVNEFTYYDEVVIKDIDVVSSSLSGQNSKYIQPTNVQTTLTGRAGQTVVYKITARNYSKTDTYIFAGTSYDTNAYKDISKLTVSVSLDAQNKNGLSTNLSSNSHRGTPVAPGEDFVFYITYTLTNDISAGEIVINYVFKPIIYSVTYLNNNETFAVEYVTNNQEVYNLIAEKPTQSGVSFAGWINVNGVVINSIRAGNTYDYTLTASWDKIFLIIFADTQGHVLYQEQFTSSSTGLSAQGQATVDQILADLNAEAQKEHMKVSWSDYTIKGAKDDIMVKAIYAYDGVLNLVPKYEQPDDGIVDYYQVEAVDTLPDPVTIPGSVGGVPVKVVRRVANTEGSSDWNNYASDVHTIIVGEGVEHLGDINDPDHGNALAYTPNLTTVKLPSTLTFMAKNTFSRNFGDDKKKLTIEFNGTKAEWKALVANSHKNWDGGLEDGSLVKCSDGYFELEVAWLGLSRSWKEKNY